MQIFISSAKCYQPVIVIKKRGSQSDHNKRLPLYNQKNSTKKCRSLSCHVGHTKKKFNPRSYIKSKSTSLPA